jgi:L-ascorbate metabolism protein UlaG (beta-lactamase superfamily)
MLRLRLTAIGTSLALAALVSTILVGGSQAQPAPRAAGPVTLEWFGWSFFRLTSPTGKVILINPFAANPDSPIKADDITNADLIFAADGHGDELGSIIPIAQNTGAKTFTAFEVGTWLMEQGVPQDQVIRSNPGGRYQLGDITLRMVGSVHGSGLPAPTLQTPYGGPAAGLVATFENGWTVYFSGSTEATQDQALWAQLYKPDMAILHMGADHEPLDFAMQVKLLKTDNPNLKMIVPHHNLVNPLPGQTTLPQVQAAVDSMNLGLQVTQPNLSQVYSYNK